MRQVALFTWTCLGSAVLILVVGNLWIGYWQLALTNLVMLILWGCGVHWNRGWAVTASLVGFSLALASGEWMGLGIGWSVVSLVLLLAAWDLQWFAWRIGAAERIEGERELVRSHILRLTIIGGAGLLLAGIALFIHLRFSFGIALLLGFSVILGLRQWILIARKAGS